jgi:hypothetical protein
MVNERESSQEPELPELHDVIGAGKFVFSQSIPLLDTLTQ